VSAPRVQDEAPAGLSLRPVIDVSERPTVVFGNRGLEWWGTMGFIIVESMTLAVCVAAYFYVRRNFQSWPPVGTALPSLGIPTLGLGLILLNLVPTYLFERAAKRLDPRAARNWLWASVLVVAAATVVRYFELGALHTKWNSDAYGSTTWMILIAHATLLIVDAFETGTLAMIFTLGKEEEKHFVATADNAFYSYFMNVVWIPLYAVVFLFPRWG
jgi:cytochrome c oxidase subunit III